MQYKPVYDFFLGSLNARGFYGFFPQIMHESSHHTYLIKAGPGCGKSTFMRMLAAHDTASHTVQERIHCSGDPRSLDGVLLSGCDALVLDATAPHAVDCVYPDVAESVVSFYDTLDRAYLRRHSDEILSLGKKHAELSRQAASHFGIACSLLAHCRKAVECSIDLVTLQTYTTRLARRTMPSQRNAAPGKQCHRLLSAPTPSGIMVFYDTIARLAPNRLYSIHDTTGAISSAILFQLAEHARINGYDAYLCHCPTAPVNKLDHLLIPSLGLGFVTSCGAHPMHFSYQKNIHAVRFTDGAEASTHRALSAWQRRLAGELINRTCILQAEAKEVHDKLEKFYITATNFDAVNAIREKLEKELYC